MAAYLSARPGDFYGPPSRHIWHCPDGYLCPWKKASIKQDIGSSLDAHKFYAFLNVQQFKPGELTVKVTGDNIVTIEGKHEEKEDEHGIISRHFLRRYKIPKDYDINKIESELSSDGILSIFAPKIETEDQESRTVPIRQTGQPAKGIKDRK